MKARMSAVLIGLTIAIAATACSSSSGGGAATSASSAPGTSSAVGTTSVAGTSTAGAGAATSGTIRIGFANMNTGTTSFPAIEQAAQAAAAYLNKTQGGLAGRKIQLVPCDLKNDDQSAQKCGQQFASDKNMPFVMMGVTLTGGPFYAALEAVHKPVLAAAGATPADNSPSGVSFYYPGSVYYQSVAAYLKSLKPKSIAFIYESNASSAAGEQYVAKALSGTGISFKATALASAATDVTASIASAGIASADVTAIITNGSCPQVVSAMKSLNIHPKKVAIAGSCATPAQIAAAPSTYQGWTYFNTFKLAAAGASGGPDVANFLSGWSKYGPGGTSGTWAELGWGLTLTAAQVFKGATTITSQSAATAIKNYHGSVTMGPKSVSCPGAAPYTSTCVNGLINYVVQNGKLVPAGS